MLKIRTIGIRFRNKVDAMKQKKKPLRKPSPQKTSHIKVTAKKNPRIALNTTQKTCLNFTKIKGSSPIEFIVGGIFALLVIMGIAQMLLIYRGSLQLQQATFEAARAGIVENGTTNAINDAFDQYSIDFHGGGTTTPELIASLARAKLATTFTPFFGGAGYKLRILNPTTQAFNDWAEGGEDGTQRAIPNAWQHIKDPTNIGETSGVSIQDANILKIEITYGVPLHMPVIGRIIGDAMAALDPTNRDYYEASPARLPLKFTALMHMQSDFYENANSISLE